ncbi:hypothetical protein [Prosthecobacter dejongeii]|uniref:Uncharacterized protein n=1 Tax=Prosthecobacter dejongeii TaxID=48465 RepID=A0A7W8DQJ4_9BACT|nr:hypothetical protein [Prosthecobacter dejongeii]MBB5038240.1 hypothetical protein [Prosthecobacter dejongeii]
MNRVPVLFRKADEQFRIAGADTVLVTINAGNRLHYVAGKGGKAVMEEAEWEGYKLLCKRFAESPMDRQDADPFAALLEPRLTTEDLWHIVTSLAAEAAEVLVLIRGAMTTLSVEDYSDALAGAERRQETVSSCLNQLMVRLRGEVPMTPQGEPLPKAEETTTEDAEQTEGRAR